MLRLAYMVTKQIMCLKQTQPLLYFPTVLWNIEQTFRFLAALKSYTQGAMKKGPPINDSGFLTFWSK